MRVRLIALVLALVSLLTSCSRDKDEEVRMEHCELGIKLSERFERVDSVDYDLAYSDGKLVVGFTRISFTAAAAEEIPSSLSEMAFARLYADKVDISRDLIKEYREFVYITLLLTNGYRSTEVFLRTHYAYFIVSFVHLEGGDWDLEETLRLTKDIYLINN